MESESENPERGSQEQGRRRVEEYADRVRNFLRSAGEASVPQLHLGLKLPTSSLFMGVGWLIKSGEILIQEKNGTLLFILQTPSPKVDKGSAFMGKVEQHPPPKGKRTAAR